MTFAPSWNATSPRATKAPRHERTCLKETHLAYNCPFTHAPAHPLPLPTLYEVRPELPHSTTTALFIAATWRV